jgi:UMF1 family MFS transporter
MFAFVATMSVIATTCLTFSTNLYNSWLPELVKFHPDIIAAQKRYTSGDMDRMELFELRGKKTADISSKGTSLGFVGVVTFLGISVGILLGAEGAVGATTALLIVCAVCAAWTIGFSLITTFGVQTREGLPIESKKQLFSASIKRLIQTFREARKLPQLLLYLFAYFVYSDGLSTMAGAAAVFANKELNMGLDGIIIAYLLSAIMAGVSSIVTDKLRRRFNLSEKAVLMGCLCVLGLIPLYGMIALNSDIEFYLVVIVYGLMNGPCVVYGRSIYSGIIPMGNEAYFFSLYSLTDKGTAWLGPLLLTIVDTKTGSFRNAFSTLVAFFYVGAFILFFFNHSEASNQREAYQKAEFEEKTDKKGLTTF